MTWVPIPRGLRKALQGYAPHDVMGIGLIHMIGVEVEGAGSPDRLFRLNLLQENDASEHLGKVAGDAEGKLTQISECHRLC